MGQQPLVPAVQWPEAGAEVGALDAHGLWRLLIAAAVAVCSPVTPCQLSGRGCKASLHHLGHSLQRNLCADAGLRTGTDWHCGARRSPHGGRDVVWGRSAPAALP